MRMVFTGNGPFIFAKPAIRRYGMDRKEYWNEEYVKYWKDVTDDANQEGTVTHVPKEKSGDSKAPGESVLITLFEILQIRQKECLLDYGCGFGRFYPYFSERSDYCGIDISQAMIEECQRRYPQARDRFLVAEGEKLPFQTESFDKIVCFGVFDACYQECALVEMMRVCKIGGEILITGKNINYFSDNEQALIAEEAARKKGHPNYFTDIKSVLQQLQNVVEVVEKRFFLFRGDFGQDKYVTDMPDTFYEWAVVLKKVANSNALKFERFSDTYSNTWKELHQHFAD